MSGADLVDCDMWMRRLIARYRLCKRHCLERWVAYRRRLACWERRGRLRQYQGRRDERWLLGRRRRLGEGRKRRRRGSSFSLFLDWHFICEELVGHSASARGRRRRRSETEEGSRGCLTFNVDWEKPIREPYRRMPGASPLGARRASGPARNNVLWSWSTCSARCAFGIYRPFWRRPRFFVCSGVWLVSDLMLPLLALLPPPMLLNRLTSSLSLLQMFQTSIYLLTSLPTAARIILTTVLRHFIFSDK